MRSWDPSLRQLERLAVGPSLTSIGERVRLALAPPPEFSRQFAQMLDRELQPDRYRRHTALGRSKLDTIRQTSGEMVVGMSAVLVFYAANLFHRVVNDIAPNYPRSRLTETYEQIPQLAPALRALVQDRVEWDQELQSSYIWQKDAADFREVQELGPSQLRTFFVTQEPVASTDPNVLKFKLKVSLYLKPVARQELAP